MHVQVGMEAPVLELAPLIRVSPSPAAVHPSPFPCRTVLTELSKLHEKLHRTRARMGLPPPEPLTVDSTLQPPAEAKAQQVRAASCHAACPGGTAAACEAKAHHAFSLVLELRLRI